jgi:tetratricopeptide (TPR) repeat protein
VVGSVLIAAAPAHVVRRNTGALAADRCLSAVVAHQPPLLAALRAAALLVERTVVASPANRTLRPVRGRAAPPGAVRAGLRPDRRARTAQHPATALTPAGADLPAALAPDDWVVDSLWAAAKTAIANGAPDSAVAYLRRALAEPPSEPVRPDLLLELGFAESYADDPQAATHLEAALETATDASAQVAITLELGSMLQIDGRNREALAVFDRTRARLSSFDRTAALTLEGAALGAAQLDADTADEAATRIAHLRRLDEEELPSSVFGTLAITASMAIEPAETVTRLALRALEEAPKLLPEAVDRPPFFYYACIALTAAER